MIQQDLFSTPLWIEDYSQKYPDLNQMLIKDGENYSLQSRKQTFPDYRDPLFNYSFLEFPGYGTQILKKLVLETIEEIAKSRDWPTHTVTMRSLQNFIHPNQCDSPHHHPDCDLTGVYYVKVPERSGDILLHETRGSIKAIWQDPKVKNDDNGKSGRVFYRFSPDEGKLILFPNYLYHSVETNLSDDSRISIVMNIRINIDEQYGTY